MHSGNCGPVVEDQAHCRFFLKNSKLLSGNLLIINRKYVNSFVLLIKKERSKRYPRKLYVNENDKLLNKNVVSFDVIFKPWPW